MKIILTLVATIALLLYNTTMAQDSDNEDKVELETTFIKTNNELPQILYIVPWKEIKNKSRKQDIIVLHSLFGTTFDPVTLDDLNP